MADTTKKVIRLKEIDLLRTNKTPGNWYITTDGRKCYYDVSNTQRQLIDVEQIPTEKQRMYESFQKTMGRLYYVWESSNLYVWNNRWEIVCGNPEYPRAYQYIDGEIFSVGDMSDDVKGNGILGDGSVVIRDVNRVIKAKISIDETNDNLIISSFLGGGIKILPNGNMEKTGALHLNPTTIGEDTDGLGEHYCEFDNINGEMYVCYDKEHWDIDEKTNKYHNDSHRYLVWHQGNLDAEGLINGWFLLKDIDKTEEGKGKTHIENTEESNGLKLKSENPALNADIEFNTHAYNGDGAPVLGELVGTDKDDPTNNSGLYVVRTEEGNIEIHLRKNKEKPTSVEHLEEGDQLLTKSEVVDLMNQKIYNAIQVRMSNSEEIYQIYDQALVPLIKEGLIISVMFNKDTSLDKLLLSVSGRSEVEPIDINQNPDIKQRPLCFKIGAIYQLLYTNNKWLVINSQMRASNLSNGYGIVRVTGESSDVSSFTVVSDSNVDLSDIKYTYDGRYSFIGQIGEGVNFPEEEESYISDKPMQYVLDVESSQGRGTSDNIDDNSVEQVLTNVDTGKKYRRYLNRDYYLKTTYEQGGLDNEGKNSTTNNIYVRQIDRTKVISGMTYKLKHKNLTNIIQVSVLKLNKDNTVSKTSYMNVSSNGVVFNTDSNTEYIRTEYRYQDDSTQLSPALIESSKILLSAVGYSKWQKIYDEDNKTPREKIKYETISLPSNKWKQTQDGNYEQIFYNWNVTRDTLVEGNMKVSDQTKLEVSHIESFNFGYKIVAVAQPTEDIEMTVIFTEAEEV